MKKILTFLALSIFGLCQQTNALVILQYHHISDSTPPSTSLSPELFQQHLAHLKENNFKVIRLESAIESLKNGTAIEDKSVVITFDDGYRSVYTTAFPLLKKYNFPFTVFVNTAPIEQKLPQFMNWKELQKLIDNGGSVANHSVNHLHLIRQNQGAQSSSLETIIRKEITDAQSLLEEKLSYVLKAFAYPYGEYSMQTKKVVKSLGFVAFGQQSGAASDKTDLQAIPRFPFGGKYGDLDDFILKVNSLPMPVERVFLLDGDNKELKEHLLKLNIDKPKLKLVLAEQKEKLQIGCYASGGEKLSSTATLDGYIFTPNLSLPVGRSRYNCTAPSGQIGRFYWFSQPWIMPSEEGLYF